MTVADKLGVGTVVAGFRLDAILGHGGMSKVFLAEDLRLGRPVAVKVMAASLAADEQFRERFLRESELAASIDHPHIVPIYQAGESSGVLFIAMRYVAGRDLARRLKHGPLEPSVAVSIVAQVADALDAAHSRGLVHRDVKPSNILLDSGTGPDGADHAYLADFGLTSRLGDESRATAGHATLMGTIDYLAPERIARRRVDGRADIYSLGCVFYECLVGEPPFRRDTDLEAVFAHLDTNPPAASTKRVELPTAFDAVITTALAKDPEGRFSTCREMARAAVTVTVDEASLQLADVASRAATGHIRLTEVEQEMAGRVIQLQVARDRESALVGAPRSPSTIGPTVCPFKGLAGFETVDEAYFFGRERLIAELVARMAGRNFLGIVGPSGSGKSSLLRAGLVPALASGVLPGSEHWRQVLIRPGERSIEEIRRLHSLGTDERLLLVVDQLEELFTAYESAEERSAFAEALTWGPAIVVVALRADFYGRFAAYPGLAERLGDNQVLVGPMQASELRRAIELPAARVGLRVEPELADAIVDDMQGEPGALPLLSTALVELWAQRREQTLTLASYVASGGVRVAVARLAESTYARVPESQRPLVRTIMLRLVGDPEVDATVRRRVPPAELDLERDEHMATVLATLVDGRLVTVSQGSVEVAHEALIREWPRLRGWIELDAQGRRLQRHLTQAAAEWDAGGRDPGELYRGARLAAALDGTSDHSLHLNALEREFVTAGRAAASRSLRRLRGLLAAVVVLLVVALVGGTLAVIQRGQARDAADRAQAAEAAEDAQRIGAQALVEQDLDLSLLLARQAVTIDDTPQTRGYLLTALARAPFAIGIMHGVDDALLIDVAVSPDGSTLAAVDFYNNIVFFDTRTFERIGEPMVATTWLASAAYSPDGTTFAYGGAPADGNAYIRLLDARTGEQKAEVSFLGTPESMTFSRDGTQLVVAAVPEGGSPAISVFEAATLRRAGPPITLPGYGPCFIGTEECEGVTFALAPDGRTIVTPSEDGELVAWDLLSGDRLHTIPIEPGRKPVALSPDGATAAVGTDDGIQLIDMASGQVSSVGGGLTGTPNRLTFSPDGATIASANVEGTATLWDVTSRTVKETLRGHSGTVLHSVFSPDGRTLYTSSADGTAIVWDLTGTRGMRRSFPLTDQPAGVPPLARGPTLPVRFSPDSRTIAIGLPDQGIGLWDANELTPSGAPLVPPGGIVRAVAFSPDRRTVAAATDSGEVTIWDLESRSLRAGPIRTLPTYLPGLAFSPDGSTLLTSGLFGGVQLWDATTLAERGNFAMGHPASDLSLAGDGTLAAFAGRGAEVWDVAAQRQVAGVPVEGEADLYSVALSPDGRTLAVGGYGRFIRLWDVGTQALLHELDPGADGPRVLEFSPDGHTLMTAGTFWDVASGARVGPALAAGPQTSMVDLSPDGRQLVATSTDGHAVVWDVDPGLWAQRACDLANRNLTPEEWATFLPGRPYEASCTN